VFEVDADRRAAGDADQGRRIAMGKAELEVAAAGQARLGAGRALEVHPAHAAAERALEQDAQGDVRNEALLPLGLIFARQHGGTIAPAEARHRLLQRRQRRRRAGQINEPYLGLFGGARVFQRHAAWADRLEGCAQAS
jgi:hypothetical protein